MSDVGISLRFIRQYDPSKDKDPTFDDHTIAFTLAMNDVRDVPMAEKLSDAMEFVKLQRAAHLH